MKKNPVYKHSIVDANATAMLCLCFQWEMLKLFEVNVVRNLSLTAECSTRRMSRAPCFFAYSCFRIRLIREIRLKGVMR